MEQRLREVLEGREGNYILPFFWQHGEEEWLLREGMRKIREAGIRAVCVESRPHPDFVGEGWWRDMDVILEAAEALDMRVWVLDDAHFPSGYANGKVGEDSPYGKILLDYYHIDVRGPMKHGGFIIDLEEGEILAAVTAALRKPNPEESIAKASVDAGNSKREESRSEAAAGVGEPGQSVKQRKVRTDLYEAKQQEKLCNIRDLSIFVENGILYWDVPEGDWVVTVLKVTRKGKMRRGYINTVDRAAVRFFIDTVYEPHYARYSELFGGRFAGFFSDEPEIGNAAEHYRIGHSQAPLPWCSQMEALLKERWKEEYGIRLTSLFCEVDGISPRARVEFMDLVTKLYEENFCGQIGDWCRQHGVEYIGHVIEDNGCHARLGLGTGHYFRALMGQDMAGIDVVLQQIRPGYGDGHFHAIGGKGTYDGRFFHYGLAAMGVSLAYLDPKKRGRTMCELYGAYGWAEGLKLMKWLGDHMLVRGVNYFVPHAFTMKEFPDRDCPPHFYARGNNPQYPYFRYLMQYMNRVSHLIQGGSPRWQVGVLYPACGEWAGVWMPFEEVGKLLAQTQIPYVVIPEDGMEEIFSAGSTQGGDGVKRVLCRVLLIPFCEYLPEHVLAQCEKAANSGVRIIFLEQLPMVLETGRLYQGKGEVLPATDLIPYLRKLGVDEICCTPMAEAFRVFPYGQPGGNFYLCFNESPSESIDVVITLPEAQGRLWRYDAFDNLLYPVSDVAGGETERKVRLQLAPWEACILYAGKMEEAYVCQETWEGISGCVYEMMSEEGCGKQDLSAGKKSPSWFELVPAKGWKVTLQEYGKSDTRRIFTWDSLMDVTSPKNFPDFSGVMEYEMLFDCPEAREGWVEIDCGEVGEIMEVWLNGCSLGVRIAPPYGVRGKGILKRENNLLKIRVVNTLVHQQRDQFSRSLPMEPSGLLGPVKMRII